MRHLLFSSLDTLHSQIYLPSLPEVLPSNSLGSTSALITGATGFIGGYLLRELLKANRFERYVCVVRGENETEARLRLISKLKEKGVKAELIHEANIEVVTGNILQPGFGIEENVFARLQEEIDHVFHFAATMNWVTPFNQDTLSNIQALREVISFCGSKHLKKLHYASSMGMWTVLNHLPGPLLESDIHDQGNELPGGYFQSKWVNEQIIHLATEKGIPSNIYRIGDVKGASADGLGDPQNFGNLVMQYFIKSGLVIDKAEPEFNFIPVDYLARAICQICLTGQEKTYQFSNPELISFRDIYHSAKAVGHDVKLLPMQAWMTELMKDSSFYGRVLKPIFKSFTPDPDLPKTSFYDIGVDMFKKPHDTTNTEKALYGSKIKCPGMLYDKILEKYMMHLGETVLPQ